jgi:manganese/zinc/iron transport system substrate-binding protein
MNRTTISFAFFATTVALSGCQRPTTDVLATTSIIADAAKRIGGDRVKVDCLMGPGVDPHKYQPSAGDLNKLSSAKLILYNGLHLEGKMNEVLEHTPGSRAVAVTQRLDRNKLRKADIDGGAHDPHVWFDVTLWRDCVQTIRDEMIAKFPEHEKEFRANADAYLAELTALDAEVREKANKLPKGRRILVTSHDAFGYFADAYGFEVWGLQGVSTASESGTLDVKVLAERIGEKRVPAVFTETSVPSQGLKQVLDTVQKNYPGHSVQLVADGDALFSDALGDPNTPGGTYVGMVRHNIDVIVRSLGK